MSKIATVYGEALYGLALEENQHSAILEEMNALKTGFEENPDFVRLLSCPNLSKEERIHILDDSFSGKISPYHLNFLKILTEKGCIAHYPGCCDVFSQLYNRDMGILPVTAVTAVPLTRDQSDRLCGKLENILSKKISLSNRVDPNCMGGVRLNYDGKQLDDTVSHRLDAISRMLSGTVL